jgi:hypothetical protein
MRSRDRRDEITYRYHSLEELASSRMVGGVAETGQQDVAVLVEQN